MLNALAWFTIGICVLILGAYFLVGAVAVGIGYCKYTRSALGHGLRPDLRSIWLNVWQNIDGTKP